MPTPEKTIDHGTLRRLVDAGAQVGAAVVGVGGGWGVVVHCGSASQRLAVTRGKPRIFRQFETLVAYLKALGIVEVHVNTAEFESGATANNPADKRSATASARMKLAHQAVAYDSWFREQVQASIDDPRPSLDDEEVHRRFAAKRAALAPPAAQSVRQPASKVARKAVA